MAVQSYFIQVILCDTQAEFNAALADLNAYVPGPAAVSILTIEQFASETPKRIVATFDKQMGIVV